jgi:hypothetical protein
VPSRVSEAENWVSGFVWAKSGVTRVWRLWSNSTRRSLLSICGLAEELTAADCCGTLFVCPGFQPKGTISRASVVSARAGGRVMIGGYQRGIGVGLSWLRAANNCERFHLLLFYWDCQGNFTATAGWVAVFSKLGAGEMTTTEAKARAGVGVVTQR